MKPLIFSLIFALLSTAVYGSSTNWEKLFPDSELEHATNMKGVQSYGYETDLSFEEVHSILKSEIEDKWETHELEAGIKERIQSQEGTSGEIEILGSAAYTSLEPPSRFLMLMHMKEPSVEEFLVSISIINYDEFGSSSQQDERLQPQKVFAFDDFPTGKDLPTWRNFFDEFESFLLRQLTDVLNALPLQDDEVNEYMKDYLARFAKEVSHYKHMEKWIGMPDEKPLQQLFRELRSPEFPASDHLLADFIKVYLINIMDDDWQNWNVDLRKAAEDGFEKSEKVGHPNAFVAYRLLVLRSTTNPDWISWRKKAFNAFPKVFYDELYHDEEETIRGYLLSDDYDRFYEDKKDFNRPLADKLAADEKVPAYIGQLADGLTHVDEAWDARGNGWSSTVEEDGWKGFGEHLEDARRALTNVWESQPQIPSAPTKMIPVSMGQSSGFEEEWKWFKRATSARFDYTDAHKALLWAMMPRWGGSHAKRVKFGQAMIATERYDTHVPMSYKKTIYGMIRDSRNYEFFQDEGITQPLIDAFTGYREKLKDHATFQHAAATFLAFVHVKKGDFTKAYELLKPYQFDVNDHYLDDSKWGAKNKFFTVRAQLYGGSTKKDIRKADEHFQNQEYEKAQPLYRRLAKTEGLADKTYHYLQLQAALCDFHQKYATGDWVSIFDGENKQWTGDRHNWKVDKNGLLQFKWKDSLGMLPAELSLKEGFELEFEFSVVPPSKKSSVKRAALFFYRPEWHQYRPLGVFFEPDDDKLEIDHGIKRSDTEIELEIPYETTNHVRIRAHDMKISVWINNRLIVQDDVLPDGEQYQQPLNIGLTDFWGARFAEWLRFANIKARALKNNHSAPESD